MLIVGSDRLSVSGLAGAPGGTRHAVDRDGRVLCRTSRARFTWPHLTWDAVSGDEGACRLCAQVRTAQEALAQLDPYPSEHSTEQPAFAAWQPAQGLFVPNEQ
jgi:hypothetical protein